MEDRPSSGNPNDGGDDEPPCLQGQKSQTKKHEYSAYCYHKVRKYLASVIPYLSAHHILAWATVVLTIIAYVALVLTQDTLESTERAWVGPTDAKIDGSPQVGKDIIASVSVTNTGREPATNFTQEIVAKLVLSDEVSLIKATSDVSRYVDNCFKRHVVRREQVIYPAVGFGGGGFTFTTKIPGNLIDKSVINGDTIIIVQGCFIYTTFERERHSAFCFFYKAKTTTDPAHLNLCAGGSDAD